MSDITRHGPRFTLLIGFDLGKPGFGFKRYIAGHYALILGWAEFHFMFGTGRDATLDVLDAGINSMKAKNN